MNILITSPSLNALDNVSGLATVVRTIIEFNSEHIYFHYLLGRPDSRKNNLNLLFKQILQLLLFPVFVVKNSIDIVHQNLPLNFKGIIREFIISLFCFFFKIPVMLHIHGGYFLMNKTDNFLLKLLLTFIFNHSKCVVVLSEIEKQALANQYGFSNVLVLPNSIDVKYYTTSRDKVSNGVPVFLFFGRIHESKGIEDILSAFKLLYTSYKFKFVLCGTGPLVTVMIREFSDLLGDNFSYKGVISGDEKLEVFRESNFFILPSRYGEGLPMSLLETMAAGLIPIVTDDASMKVVVRDSFNGFIVKKNSPQELFAKIKYIIDEKQPLQNISYNAVMTVNNNYSIDSYIHQLNDIYCKILNKCFS